MSDRKSLTKLIRSSMFLALAMVLPLLTGQIPQIGKALCPMHLPVILCGFFCGPMYGLVVGFIAPLLRFLIFGMPVIMPTGIGMCFELGAYGFFSGLLYTKLKKTKVNIYVSLICAMLIGRIIWGVSRVVLLGIFNSPFGWAAFMAGAFTNAIPGIIVQIVLIPVLVMTLDKSQAMTNS